MLSLFVHPAARISSWKMWMWLFTTFSWGTSSPHSFNWPSYALQGKENWYSLVKSNQSQKCQISLLWSLCYFWAAKHFKKLQKGSHCAKKSSFLPYFVRAKMKQSLQESYYQPCAHQPLHMPCTTCSRRKANRAGMPCSAISFTTGSVLSYAFFLGLQIKEK